MIQRKETGFKTYLVVVGRVGRLLHLPWELFPTMVLWLPVIIEAMLGLLRQMDSTIEKQNKIRIGKIGHILNNRVHFRG